MAPRRKPKPADPAAPIRHLIALDAANVMRRLAVRQDEMVSLFSRLRDREPLLTTVHSWFSTISFEQLASLDPREQLAVNAFYDLLAELRWYLQYTEDMPGTVQQTLALRVRRLVTEHERLTSVLGPPRGSGGPVVDAEVVKPRVAALASGSKSGRRSPR